jgi:hypothetical protein
LDPSARSIGRPKVSGVGQNGLMKQLVVRSRALPLPARWACVGAVAAGSVGAIAGLVIGLIVYAPTAPFALVEVALPAALVGGVVGSGCRLVAIAVRRLKRDNHR